MSIIDYLKTNFQDSDDSFVDYAQFAFRVAEDPQGILIIQSDIYEYDLIDDSKLVHKYICPPLQEEGYET